MGSLERQRAILLHLPTADPRHPYAALAVCPTAKPELLDEIASRSRAAGWVKWWRKVRPYYDVVARRVDESGAKFTRLNTGELFERSKQAEIVDGLWCRGVVGPPPYLVVVGPRNPSSYAMDVAGRLVRAVAPHCTVISGLAMGIDTIALLASVSVGGYQVALSPTGVATPTPNTATLTLRKMLAARKGLLLSEYLFCSNVSKSHFLHRNRLLAVMADVVLVVEGAARSGTLSTARIAIEVGTTVAVVPGDITRPTALGSNTLIRDGAQPVLGPADLAGLLGIEWRERSYPTKYNELIRALERGCNTVEQLAEVLGMGLSDLTSLLLAAEQASIVARTQNGVVHLVKG